MTNAECVRRYRSKPGMKEILAERQRKYRSENKDKVRESSRRAERKRRLKRYGITEEDYNFLWLSQGCKCGNCGTVEVKSNRHWHVDHNHLTGKVRGILCSDCNILMGYAKEDPQVLQAAIKYLEKHNV